MDKNHNSKVKSIRKIKHTEEQQTRVPKRTEISTYHIIKPEQSYNRYESSYDMESLDESAQQPMEVQSHTTYETREMSLSEQTDKWISALALVELASGV